MYQCSETYFPHSALLAEACHMMFCNDAVDGNDDVGGVDNGSGVENVDGDDDDDVDVGDGFDGDLNDVAHVVDYDVGGPL